MFQMTRNMEDLLQKRQEEEEEDLELELESRKVNELKRCKKTVASCVVSEPVSESEDSLDSEDKSDQLILSIADVKVSSLITLLTQVGFHKLFIFNKNLYC